MNRPPIARCLSSLLASAALTASVAAASGGSVTASPEFVSQYMFRGERLGGPSFQPTLEFDAGDLALGLWANLPLASKVPGQSDPEIDPYVSYKAFKNLNILS